jgi:hypothetical protein
MLKVTTSRKEISPALCRWTRLWYIRTGLLPVGKPSTKGFSGVGLKALMRSASPLVGADWAYKGAGVCTNNIICNVLGCSMRVVSDD